MKRLTWPLIFSVVALAACVSGEKVRADAKVLQTQIDRARLSGAYQCAPRELATAEAQLDFAQGELKEGSSNRAAEHARISDNAVRRALALSKKCSLKTVTVKTDLNDPPLIVKIEDGDRDGDGIPDSRDACPDQPEDKDGFQDEDGCPDLDNDKDGVPNALDKCPSVPGPASNAGCPLSTVGDRDADGIPDDQDQCPDRPEDKDGFQDEDGCPDPDNDNDGVNDLIDRCPLTPGALQADGCPIVDRDGDGINDELDKCPDEPEDKDGFQDEDGCPDLDNDNDGIPDTEDKCPNQPGVVEEQGCPRKYKLIVVKKDRIEIKQQIKFRTASSKIVGENSFLILSEVAQALKDNPQIKKLRVEGHTDSVGNDAFNLKLSQGRANSVRAALTERGIDPDRLEAVGFGETKPIASNTLSSGRAENRRTEFNIVDQ